MPQIDLELLNEVTMEVVQSEDKAKFLIDWVINNLSKDDQSLALYLGVNVLASNNFNILMGFYLAHETMRQQLLRQELNQLEDLVR